jgi:hemoglobin
MADKTLYDRLGGAYAIAAVIGRFSDRLLEDPSIVNANPELREWHTVTYRERLPGLKFLRTLWVCAVAGGPFEYTAKGLEEAHRDLHVSPEVFDAVAGHLAETLDEFKVPEQEKQEVLGAFAAHKGEVTAGAKATAR